MDILVLILILIFVVEALIIWKNKKIGNIRYLVLGIMIVLVVLFGLSFGFLFGDIAGIISILVCTLISHRRKTKSEKIVSTEIKVEPKKTIRDSLKANEDVIQVLEINDNIAALARCTALFEKDIITKSEFQELEEYIKSRV